jgi:hypothetical protein
VIVVHTLDRLGRNLRKVLNRGDGDDVVTQEPCSSKELNSQMQDLADRLRASIRPWPRPVGPGRCSGWCR